MNTRIQFWTWCCLLVVAAGFLVGCGGGGGGGGTVDPPTPLDKVVADNLATQAVAAAQGGPLAMANGILFPMFAPQAVSGGGAHLRGARPSRTGTVRTDSTEFWYDLHAFDAAGNEIDWDGASADSIARLTMAWRWHVEFADEDGSSFLWVSAGTFEYTGFASTEPRLVVNATDQSQLDIEARENGEWFISHMNSRDAVDHVVWEKSGEPAYPMAGVIGVAWKGNWDYNYSGTKNAGSVDTNTKLSFDGTKFASLVVDNRYHYKVNLETGAIEGLGGPPL